MTAGLRCFQMPVQHWGRSIGVVSRRNWKSLKISLLSIIQLAAFAAKQHSFKNER
jgi:hypothetical protein